MHIVTIAALLVAWAGWWRGRTACRGTTLMAAWYWGQAALAMTVLTAGYEFLEGRSGSLGAGCADHLWYASCVLWLCPPVSVLGARRPGAAAWGGFVMLPLVLMLEWPVTGVALAGWISGIKGQLSFEPIRLDWPELVAILVVLVLGMGNHLVTRRGWCVVAAAAGIESLLLPLTGWVPDESVWTTSIRVAGACLIAAAITWSRRPHPAWSESAGRLAHPRSHGLAVAWDDFVQAYGIVWAVRVEARVNEDLKRLNCGASLGPRGVGFEDEAAVSPEEQLQAIDRAEQTLRWLWRRFVDASWIDTRLGLGAPLGAKEPRGL
tara:strand:+ start:355 stop:1317 length:963 start_codon:yes stop_codon:yes gene_type:complete